MVKKPESRLSSEFDICVTVYLDLTKVKFEGQGHNVQNKNIPFGCEGELRRTYFGWLSRYLG